LGLRQGGGPRRRGYGWCRAQRSDRSENPFSMAERNAQFLQIGLGHIGQDLEIDGILGKGGRVLGEPDLIKPGFYLVIAAYCRGHSTYCSARALSGHAAASPSRVMNSRRLMPNHRLARLSVGLPQRSACPRAEGSVLGADLNCSESRWGAAGLL